VFNSLYALTSSNQPVGLFGNLLRVISLPSDLLRLMTAGVFWVCVWRGGGGDNLLELIRIYPDSLRFMTADAFCLGLKGRGGGGGTRKAPLTG
jgi:hypothetical protein